MSIEYKCSVCGAENCKLWRGYQSFRVGLFCLPCGFENQKLSIGTKPRNPDEPFSIEPRYDGNNLCIAWLVPAVVASRSHGTFWAYTDIPEYALREWKELPDKPIKADQQEPPHAE